MNETKENVGDQEMACSNKRGVALDSCVMTKIEDFTILKPISRGAFGKVFLGCKINNQSQLYAIKVVKKSEVVNKNMMHQVQVERDALALSKSPFVVQIFYSLQSAQNIYLIMEYMIGGDVKSLLHVCGYFEEDMAVFYIAEVASALEYLHNHNIIHRDLKPDNMLVSNCGHIKLTDFGLSKVNLEKQVNIDDLIGTPSVSNPQSQYFRTPGQLLSLTTSLAFNSGLHISQHQMKRAMANCQSPASLICRIPSNVDEHVDALGASYEGSRLRVSSMGSPIMSLTPTIKDKKFVLDGDPIGEGLKSPMELDDSPFTTPCAGISPNALSSTPVLLGESRSGIRQPAKDEEQAAANVQVNSIQWDQSPVVDAAVGTVKAEIFKTLDVVADDSYNVVSPCTGSPNFYTAVAEPIIPIEHDSEKENRRALFDRKRRSGRQQYQLTPSMGYGKKSKRGSKRQRQSAQTAGDGVSSRCAPTPSASTGLTRHITVLDLSAGSPEGPGVGERVYRKRRRLSLKSEKSPGEGCGALSPELGAGPGALQEEQSPSLPQLGGFCDLSAASAASKSCTNDCEISSIGRARCHSGNCSSEFGESAMPMQATTPSLESRPPHSPLGSAVDVNCNCRPGNQFFSPSGQLGQKEECWVVPKQNDATSVRTTVDMDDRQDHPAKGCHSLEQKMHTPHFTHSARRVTQSLAQMRRLGCTPFRTPKSVRRGPENFTEHRIFGTPDYLAPELLMGNRHGPEVDWWALGVCLFEFLTGCPPFNDQSPELVYNNILSRDIPWPSGEESLSTAARDAVSGLLTLDPSRRPGAKEIKDFDLFSGTTWDRLLESEAPFVPSPDDEMDTAYFQARNDEQQLKVSNFDL